jgi:hypothetical protein
MIPDVPYDWMALRMAYQASRHECEKITVGVDGYGGVVEVPLTVELTVAWASRAMDDD